MRKAVEPVTKTVLPATPITGKPLGRHVHHDPRSWSYPAERAAVVSSVQHAASGLPLAQADVHLCSTAHSLCAAINCSDPAARPMDEVDAVRVYETATRMEPFFYARTPVPGSSGLMACKAAHGLGLIASYTHAFGIQHALEALVLRPVMTGINWYTSFDRPDPETGLVDILPGATVRGGHEVVADAIDADAQLVWFWNSWGPAFGKGGRFCMTFETWDRLLQERGDVTVPIV